MASPNLFIESPIDRAVYQRGPEDLARVAITGTITGVPRGGGYHVRSRVIAPDGKESPGQNMSIMEGKSRFAGEIQLPAGGWYRVIMEAIDGTGKIASAVEVEHVGAGEVFVTAGQSNSANSGTVHIAPKSDLVSARGRDGWIFAKDPQPVAAGEGGTPWPSMADALVETLHVPIGLISVGVGGTAVATWMPGGKQSRWKWLARFTKANNFPRLEWAVQVAGVRGARAVLWHQGESDSIEHTATEIYATRLRAVIAGSRSSAIWNIPWLVARAGFHTSPNPGEVQAVVAGQEAVVDNTGIFQGPTTDDMLGLQWRAPDLVHFNEAGLVEHGQRWARAILQVFFKK
jgi:hypothetical protein